MTSHLITGIGELLTNEAEQNLRTNAAIVIDGDRIAWVGSALQAPECDRRTDVDGRAVIPGFVDSHAHLVFAGDRVNDFVARMTGQSYSAGGITTTVAATRAASDEQLRDHVGELVHAMHHEGITTLEIKSGYGLTVDDEVRALKIASEYTPETTFLGAHVVPNEYRDDRAAYVALVTGTMLEKAKAHAKWIDVFCDRGAFNEDESRTVLTAGIKAGLMPRVHGNQLQPGPGIALAVEFNAASVDHATFATDADLDLLAGSHTVATLLPGAEFCTRAPYPDARRFYNAGVKVALATDCNPGTSFVTSMSWVIATAVRDMFFTPTQAVQAATIGGAAALRRDDIGRIAVGTRADLVVLDAATHQHIAYRPGTSLISAVLKDGVLVA